jgi:hypothetical protein
VWRRQVLQGGARRDGQVAATVDIRDAFKNARFSDKDHDAIDDMYPAQQVE